MGKTKIKVNYTKCTNPEECKICLKLCQPAVLILTFTDTDYYNPKNWKLVPAFPGLCIGCNLCVEQCPQQAITVKIK